MDIRIFLGLALVFVLPGFAITTALLPEEELGLAKRVALGVGLSMSATILSGLALQASGVGLQPTLWAVLLSFITLFAVGITLIRQQGRVGLNLLRAGSRVTARDAGFFALAAAMIITAVALARIPAPPQGAQGYTSLYLVPAHNGNASQVRLGVTSDEFTLTKYHLQVQLNKTVSHEWNEIDLKPGETWEVILELPGGTQATGKLEADLYRLDRPTEVYRHVSLLAGPAAGQD